MLGDETLAEAVRVQIECEHRCAEWAVQSAIQVIARRLAALDDHYLRERSHDIEFVGERLLRALGGDVARAFPISGSKAPPSSSRTTSPRPTPPRWSTSPSSASSSRWARAPATRDHGARAGDPGRRRRERGHPPRHQRRHGDRRRPARPRHRPPRRGRARRRPRPLRATRRVLRELAESRDRPRGHQRRRHIALRANVELPAEAILARDQGAEGIGLYRTEFLYIDRSSPPTEDEQYEVYSAVVEAMRPKPVVLRTFDIGGDKFASTFQLPEEMNPMLGLRAVRLALSRPDVFLEQLRAMLRASAYGNVKIMIPMVASLGELRHVRSLLAEAQADVAPAASPAPTPSRSA
jgi:phosphotransferase system enzyme I (PtsI)